MLNKEVMWKYKVSSLIFIVLIIMLQSHIHLILVQVNHGNIQCKI